MAMYAALFDFLRQKAAENRFPNVYKHQELRAAGRTHEEINSWCDATLRYTREFAKRHDLCFEDLVDRLRSGPLGCRCDCDALTITVFLAPPPVILSKEGCETPAETAIREGLYAHCRVEGRPVSFLDALSAVSMGKEAEMWVPCGKDAPYAMPDVKRVIAREMGLKEYRWPPTGD